MKPIVTDTYDFPTLIRRGYVYVDETVLCAAAAAVAVGMIIVGEWLISGIRRSVRLGLLLLMEQNAVLRCCE